ncbi:MAG: helicase C-terminal domain-containing protein, partial [Candidatus Omnitrophota bacterium]
FEYNSSINFKYSGLALNKQFGSLYLIDNYLADCFDWAYCITVWKAQGSEWDSVVFIEERMHRMDDDTWRKFLYTGITRARERLLIVAK